MDRPHRGIDLLMLGDCDRVEHLAWDVAARNKRTSGHKRLARQRRVVCHHVDHPHVRAARRQVLKQRRITRVEALHVSHLHDQAGLVSTPANRVCVHRVDTQRLLDQNVHAGLECPERDLGMGGVRRTNHDRVHDLRVQHAPPVAIRPRGRITHAERLTDRLARIDDGDELKPLAQPRYPRQMDRLSDQPAAYHADAQNRAHAASPLPVCRLSASVNCGWSAAR